MQARMVPFIASLDHLEKFDNVFLARGGEVELVFRIMILHQIVRDLMGKREVPVK